MIYHFKLSMYFIKSPAFYHAFLIITSYDFMKQNHFWFYHHFCNEICTHISNQNIYSNKRFAIL